MSRTIPRLKLLPINSYVGINRADPIRLYGWPILGRLYRRRVELCLAQCRGGQRILEIGFGSGVTFLNLHDMYEEIHGLDLTADAHAVQSAFAARNVRTHLQNGSVLNMPFPDDHFDAVLLISILEHLQPNQQAQAFAEIRRVLKPAGQVVYGVPVERPFMVFMFRLLGYNIREHHFSTERDVSRAADANLRRVGMTELRSPIPSIGPLYQVGSYIKPG